MYGVSFLPLLITDDRNFQISTDTNNMLSISQFYSTFSGTIRTNQSLQLRMLNLVRRSFIQVVYANEMIRKFCHGCIDIGKWRLHVVSVT
jgi:hypothetical protein